MGTVSTALTEEELSKCLERSIYHTLPTEPGTLDSAGAHHDVKCSICQVHILGSLKDCYFSHYVIFAFQLSLECDQKIRFERSQDQN